jgi:hypothetical protein
MASRQIETIDGKLYRNKVNMRFVVFVFLALLIFAVALGIYYGSINSILFSLFMWLFSVAIAIEEVLRKFPKWVAIQDDGLTLVSFLGKSRNIKFSQIEKLVIHPLPSQKKIPLSLGVGGYIRINGRREFALSREVAEAIKGAYTKKNGSNPPS